MIHKCKCCNKFIAKIKQNNNMELKGKSIKMLDSNLILIKCECGTWNVIELDKS